VIKVANKKKKKKGIEPKDLIQLITSIATLITAIINLILTLNK